MNKLKVVKRALYGRAKFDPRQRVLPTANGPQATVPLGDLTVHQLLGRALGGC